MSAFTVEELFDKFKREKDEISKWKAFMRFLKKFKRAEYSTNNKIVVFMQKEDATEVYGFQEWKNRWRHVMKWETGIKVFAMNEREKENDKWEKEVKKFFGRRTVFDITQTTILDLNQK